MLPEKERLKEELKLLDESFKLDVITKEEYENAKVKIEEKLKQVEIDEQQKKELEKKELVKPKEEIKPKVEEPVKEEVHKEAEKLSKSDMIPPSKYKDMLIDAPTYIINKMLREINVTI